MKYLVMILLSVISGNVAAEWVEVNHNEHATGYANPATIVKDGNIVKMWQLVDFKTITKFTDGAPFMSDKSQEEYDCKEKQSRTIIYSLRSGNMGEGAVVFSDSNPTKWEPVMSGSKMEQFWNIACGMK
jgi:hypothetical protein